MTQVQERVEVRTVVAEPLTVEAFEPFGDVLGPEGRERLPIDLYGGTVDAYNIPVHADEPFEWLVNRLRYRGLRIINLERHHGLSQAFIPMDGAPFIQVVAAADARLDNDVPASDEVRAFIVPGNRGVQIDPGVWHEPPFPMQSEQMVIVTSHQSLTKGLASKVDASQEIAQLDVDKRNITDRAGYELRISLP
jgi:ureidoglycolate lyase